MSRPKESAPTARRPSLWGAERRQVFEALYGSVQYGYCMQVEGDVIEFGTMSGDTAALLAEAIAACDRLLAPRYGPVHGAPKTLWLLDSFKGLPEAEAEADRSAPHVRAGVWAAATCRGISPALLAKKVARHLPRARSRVVEGWFSDTVPQLPAATRFACIHVDCDLYASTVDALGPLFARDQVADGAVILFDDWNCNRASPLYGQRKAWNELVLRHRIRFSDEGRCGIASRRFIVHGYERAPVPVGAGGDAGAHAANAAQAEIAALTTALAETRRQLAEREAELAAAATEMAQIRQLHTAARRRQR